MASLDDYIADLEDSGPDTPVDLRKPEYALALLADIALRAGESKTYVMKLAETVFNALPKEPTYDDVLTDAIFRAPNPALPVEQERTRIIQSNEVAGIVIEVHHKAFGEDVYVDLGLRYGIADALWDAGLRFPDSSLPLDPEPWVVHSLDSRVSSDRPILDSRVSSDRPILGYRHNFEPREGYSQDRSRYTEVNDGRG